MSSSDEDRGVLLWLDLLHHLDLMLVTFHKHQPVEVTIWQVGPLGSQNSFAYREKVLNNSTGLNGSVILGEHIDQDLLNQKRHFSQNLLRDGFQLGFHQVLRL